MKYVKYLLTLLLVLVLLNLGATWYLGKELQSFLQKQTVKLKQAHLDDKFTFKVLEDGFFSKTVAIIPTGQVDTSQTITLHVYPGIIPFGAITKSGLRPVLYYVDLKAKANELPEFVKQFDGYFDLSAQPMVTLLVEKIDQADQDFAGQLDKGRFRVYGVDDSRLKADFALEGLTVQEKDQTLVTTKSLDFELDLADVPAYIQFIDAFFAGNPDAMPNIGLGTKLKAKDLVLNVPDKARHKDKDTTAVKVDELVMRSAGQVDVVANTWLTLDYDYQVTGLSIDQKRLVDLSANGQFQNIPIDVNSSFGGEQNDTVIILRNLTVKTDKPVFVAEAEFRGNYVALSQKNASPKDAVSAFFWKSMIDLPALSALGQQLSDTLPLSRSESHELSQATNLDTLRMVFSGIMASEGYVKVKDDVVEADVRFDGKTGKLRLTNGKEVDINNLP